MSSPLALLINLASVGVYGYSIYYMNYDVNLRKVQTSIQPLHAKYGPLKFLTYQCLVLQFINAILHVGAHFVGSLRKPRDILFTALAYPIGSIVVYSFWGVWHTLGRELIFPTRLSSVYPDWLNHATHSIIVPINILLAVLVHHDYGRRRFLITAVYFAFYVGLLHFIKLESGNFVYPYLETMSQPVRIFYFLTTGAAAYLMLKSGQLLDNIFHSKASQRPALKRSKQK